MKEFVTNNNIDLHNGKKRLVIEQLYQKRKQKKLEKYSFGIGDRFGHQGKAQLNAIIKARKLGLNIVPVWNKSYREHLIINTGPLATRKEADAATAEYSWNNDYYVDADHVDINNVSLFLGTCDFFTLDIAEHLGKKSSEEDIEAFVDKYVNLIGSVKVEGIDHSFHIEESLIRDVAEKILLAIQKAGELYRYIEQQKGKGTFITEISIDETDIAQKPLELLFILAAIADEGIPVQTIAPKFTGRFNKGVDYVGDVSQFEKEFNEILAVIKYAKNEFDLPDNLKLSIHSGSDKYSIYHPINRALKRFGAGIHVKTAGTTWLEEVAGLAAAGGNGLLIAKEIYSEAYRRFDELCKPYDNVIDIEKSRLPLPEEINSLSSEQFVKLVRHDITCPYYDPDVRQLLHVGYKVAAEMGSDFTDALEEYEDAISRYVTKNISQHIKSIFY